MHKGENNMQTEYQTYIEFCDYNGKIHHTLRHWNKLSDFEIRLLTEHHKKQMQDYEVRVFCLENREYVLRKIVQSIPDSNYLDR